MNKQYIVEFTKFASKQLEKLPNPIRETVHKWIKSVELVGLSEVRKRKSYHDEPLKGSRHGQRSVRLNKAYRLFYEEFETGEIVLIGIKEINKHEY